MFAVGLILIPGVAGGVASVFNLTATFSLTGWKSIDLGQTRQHVYAHLLQRYIKYPGQFQAWYTTLFPLRTGREMEAIKNPSGIRVMNGLCITRIAPCWLLNCHWHLKITP